MSPKAGKKIAVNPPKTGRFIAVRRADGLLIQSFCSNYNALAKSECNVCGQWFDDSELDDHLNAHLEGPTEEPGLAQRVLKCPTCDKVMDTYYVGCEGS